MVSVNYPNIKLKAKQSNMKQDSETQTFQNENK